MTSFFKIDGEQSKQRKLEQEENICTVYAAVYEQKLPLLGLKLPVGLITLIILF